MPTYIFKNKETGETKEMIVSISKMEEMTSEEGDWIQIIGSPTMVTHIGGTLKQAGSEWKDLLGKIKKGSGRNNTIHD